MYNINISNLGQKLKYYRKLNGFSMQKLGNIIYKSKATISKYENSSIIPDINTLLIICNALNIKIEQLLHYEKKQNIKNIKNSNNFNLYYYTGSNLIISKIEILEDNTCKFYNDIINDTSKYIYSGLFKSDASNVFFQFSSDSSKLEEVTISYNPQWNNIQTYNLCFVSGITPNYIPVIKKGIISEKILDENTIKEILEVNNTKKSNIKEWQLQ